MIIDHENQIRGYYALPNLDELDKLEVELKIVLTKF
jgi:hypothetical protein